MYTFDLNNELELLELILNNSLSLTIDELNKLREVVESVRNRKNCNGCDCYE